MPTSGFLTYVVELSSHLEYLACISSLRRPPWRKTRNLAHKNLNRGHCNGSAHSSFCCFHHLLLL